MKASKIATPTLFWGPTTTTLDGPLELLELLGCGGPATASVHKHHWGLGCSLRFLRGTQRYVESLLAMFALLATAMTVSPQNGHPFVFGGGAFCATGGGEEAPSKTASE